VVHVSLYIVPLNVLQEYFITPDGGEDVDRCFIQDPLSALNEHHLNDERQHRPQHTIPVSPPSSDIRTSSRGLVEFLWALWMVCHLITQPSLPHLPALHVP